ncbi:syncytin-A-like [Hyla sarda]|uniref:syncytin-A-like n=1 Tax=Hyla sarda TaxID=327740 RepID=UPI0024C2B976|nr:syncytin-A-like [Hyla sarda]XP_056416441.1 syncytin-A-like [Hyla sarda]
MHHTAKGQYLTMTTLWFLFNCLIFYITTLHDELEKHPDDKFLKHHLMLAQNLTVKDCWICTHAPTSARSMPYLAIPVPPHEMFQGDCFDTLASNKTRYTKNWNTSVGIPIVGWIGQPWWQGSLSSFGQGSQQILTFKRGSWVACEVTQILDLGRIPTQGIKVSFSRTSVSTDTFKPSQIERYLHDNNWLNNSPFPQGTGEECYNMTGHQKFSESSYYQPYDPTCNNPDVGYCGTLGQKPGWCYMTNASRLSDIVNKLINQNSSYWELPRDTYWVCGREAYKWLPVGVNGTCTLARLTPSTFVIPNKDVDMRAVPRHMLYQRAADNKERENGRPHVVQMGTANKLFSTLLVYPMMMQMWDKLVEATAYLDDQIYDILEITNTSVSVQNQLMIVTNQHAIVLDYLTAAQGGMCQIIGPTCCHYIDTPSTIQMHHQLESIQKLREQYTKDNDQNKGKWWGDTFSIMNPATWLKGIGGWIGGSIHFILQVAVVILLSYLVIKLLMICISHCNK